MVRTTKLRASLSAASEAYNNADANGDGRLSFAEYRAMPHNIGPMISEEELRTGFAELDHDGSGYIDMVCRARIERWTRLASGVRPLLIPRPVARLGPFIRVELCRPL